jgi:hypothetical protein
MPFRGRYSGFLLSTPDSDTAYISGDNASRHVVRRIVEKTGEIPIAIEEVG